MKAMSFGAPSKPDRLRPIRVQAYVFPFIDHRKQPATTVYENWVHNTLPPLTSFAVYFVHSTTSIPISDKSAQQLLTKILEDGGHEVNPFRLELFYLPNADVEVCMNHHIAERSVRGSYKVQIDTVEMDVRRASTETAPGPISRPLPGLPPSYLIFKGEQYYHQLFFVCHTPTWNTNGDTQLFECVEYDPVSRAEYAQIFDPEELEQYPERGVLTTFQSGIWAAVSLKKSPAEKLQDSDGVYVRSVNGIIMQRGDFEGRGDHEGTIQPFQRARQLGWMHW